MWSLYVGCSRSNVAAIFVQEHDSMVICSIYIVTVVTSDFTCGIFIGIFPQYACKLICICGISVAFDEFIYIWYMYGNRMKISVTVCCVLRCFCTILLGLYLDSYLANGSRTCLHHQHHFPSN